MRGWIYNLSLIIILFSISCTPPSGDFSTSQRELNLDILEQVSETVEVRNAFGEVLDVLDAPNLSLSEKRARNAAVKVRSLLQGGHGSGTYAIVHNRRVVITAAHVVRSETVMAIDGRDGETVVGKVVFTDIHNDVAFLVVPEMETRVAVKYRPYRSYDERLIGANLTYTGFPSHHDLLTIRGYVAALEHEMVVTNMFGWFGSSGSGVFDERGRLVGVVSGIDVGNIGFRLPLETIVWVAPVSPIDHATLKVRVVTADPPDSLKAFPGAAAPRRGSPRQ